MTATIMDGKATADKIRAGIKAEVENLKMKPGLAAVLVGKNPASQVYVEIKRKTCNEVGIYSELYKLPEERFGIISFIMAALPVLVFLIE